MISSLPDVLQGVLELGRLSEEAELAEAPRACALLADRADFPDSPFAAICDIFGLDNAERIALSRAVRRAALSQPFPTERENAALCLELGKPAGEPLSLLLSAQSGTLLKAACDILFGQAPRLPDYLRLDAHTDQIRYHQSALLEQADAYINAAMADEASLPAALALTGPAGSGKRFLLAELAEKRGCTLLVADCARTAPEHLPELAGIAMLTGSLVCLDGYADKHAPLATGLFQWFSLVLLACGGEPAVPGGCGSLLVRPVGILSYGERLEALRDLLGDVLPHSMLEQTAAMCRVSVGKLVSAAARIKAELKTGAAMTERDLVRALNRESTMALSQNADLVVTGKYLADLTLPQEQKRQVESICNYARGRETVWKTWGFENKIPYGQGLTALFYGASGTGKTLAASVVANELGLELYRVDLSRLISKYIGETQKNIGKIFDDAQGAECILFFDEADALFSRRSEVADANDRYANAEIAYLLQRTEQYDGIILMATNLLQNFDEAFRRRIGFMIHFPMPDEPLREQLWRGIFPAEAPLDSLDFPLLAKQLELSGASVRAIALNAARMAAADGGAVDMGRVIAAARDEYRKLGKTFPVSLTMMFV